MLQEIVRELSSSTVGEHLSSLEEEDSEGAEYVRGPPALLRKVHKALSMRERSLGAENQCGIVQKAASSGGHSCHNLLSWIYSASCKIGTSS